MRPPEPTAEEAAVIHGAHDAIRERYGAINWGTATRPMREVWADALEAGVITGQAFDLAKRDSGALFDCTADSFL